MSETAKPITPKKKKSRSPNYPAISLEKAIQKARTIYDHDKRNATSLSVIAQHWKSNAKSSSTLTAVASLRAFGLLDDLPGGKDQGGPNYKLSEAALRIIIDSDQDSIPRVQAIKACALKPSIHAQLWKKYDGELPSDANMQTFLCLERHFTEEAARLLLKQFKETIAYARLAKSDQPIGPIDVDEEDDEEERSEEIVDPKEEVKPKDPKAPSNREFTFPIAGGTGALKLPWPLDKKGFKTLHKYIEFLMESEGIELGEQ